MPLRYDQYFREVLLEPAAHGDGHVLAVTVALPQNVANSRDLAINSRAVAAPVADFCALYIILLNVGYKVRSQVEIRRAGQEAPARASDEQLLPLT
jgi:hypothetical protein